MKIRSLVHSGKSLRTGMPQRLLPAVLTPIALIALGVGWAGPDNESSRRAPAPAVSLRAPSVPEPKTKAAPRSPALPRSAPMRLLIPSIGVDAPFTDLAIGPSGRLNAPPSDHTNLVGWFADGPSPGERGTAIVAGHLDTKTAPAVFAGLSTLTPGKEIRINRADGRTVTFVVYAADNLPQDDFPDDLVYADTPDAQLRLITCGGGYDRSKQRYMENTVVFARLKTSATDG
jgi:sortase (surface protein transpeptidase)